jgi:hypothetical protein
MMMFMEHSMPKNATAQRNGHDHATDGTCPYCGAPLTAASLVKIGKIEADLEARISSEVTRAQIQANTEIDRAKREAAKAVEATVAARLRAQREADEKKLTEAVAAERSRAYEERMRLDGQLADLQRQIQRRTAGDLGNEAEVDLFELLKTEFPDDEIVRVARGVAGPDIVHRIAGCGAVIIYDSKNHKSWATRWTTKLRDDMKLVSPPAEHAVLVVSPTAFPKGEHHGLLFRDSVMIVTSTRVIPVVHLMRRQAIQAHALRLSHEQRDEKTTKLFVLLTSNRIADLWERHSEALRGLLDIERADERHQGKTRAQRVELVNSIRSMIHDDLVKKIDDIMSGLAEEGSL